MWRAQRIGEIVAGRRMSRLIPILRLCKFFGLSNGYWLRAQAAYDTRSGTRSQPQAGKNQALDDS